MRLRALVRHAWPYRSALLMLAVLTMVSSAVMLAIPWLAGHLLGSIVAGGGFGDVRGRVIALLILALAASAMITFAVALQSATTGARLLADLRQRVYDHVQRLPIGFHESRGKGDTLALMTYEIARLSQFLTGTLVAIPARLLTTVGAVVLMFRIDPRLAMVVPILVPAFYLILKIVGRRLRSLAVAIQRAEANVVAIAEQTLEMLPATKAFTREEAEAENYRTAVDEASQLRVREGRIHAVLEPLIGLLAALAAVLILVWSGDSVQAGRLSPQQLFSFIFYAALLTRPVSALAQVYGEAQTARGTLARLQSVLDQPIEELTTGSATGHRAQGEIHFDNVVFAYPGRDPVLAGASLHIRPGEVVALLGPNGAGKTALINLLLRYYEVQGGTISLDGEDISKLAVGDLRRHIGLVPQGPFLFNATIRENIAFGAENPTQQHVDEAARLAQASDFITGLPHRMETMIGDRGVRLSGGQKQRIALARALIKDPPILIFDEATSMFDSAGEDAFIETCGRALKGRTVILVTHRPATLALADRAITLKDGVLVVAGEPQGLPAHASA